MLCKLRCLGVGEIGMWSRLSSYTTWNQVKSLVARLETQFTAVYFLVTISSTFDVGRISRKFRRNENVDALLLGMEFSDLLCVLKMRKLFLFLFQSLWENIFMFTSYSQCSRLPLGGSIRSCSMKVLRHVDWYWNETRRSFSHNSTVNKNDADGVFCSDKVRHD